jgi:short-subunit dehydrogenase
LIETSAEEAAAMMALPYLAAFNLTRELLPGMLKRRSGHIVNIASYRRILVTDGVRRQRLELAI